MKKILLFLFVLTFLPVLTFAHQPRIVESDATEVIDPEISKAYYATLSGAPHIYTIDSKVDFDLYVSILLPDIKSADKSTVAEVFKGEESIATLGGKNADWKSFFEPFGQSNYLDGGEYKARAEAGVYTITVKSDNNDSKYSLAVGEIEAFDRAEGMNALSIIPELKRDFFEESPITFIRSPFGWGLIVVMYVLAFAFGLIYRAIAINISMLLLKMRLTKGAPKVVDVEIEPKKKKKNMGKSDRILRVVIGLGFLLWAILTTWNPLLIFISGFCMFEAVFSWCAFYHAIEKDTCTMR